DYLKSKKNTESFGYFIADQLAHLIVILVLWISIENNSTDFGYVIASLLANDRFWIIAAGYVFVSWPLGIMIGKATRKWRDQITKEKENQETNRITSPVADQEDPLLPEIIEETNQEGVKAGEEQELGLASAGK